MQNFNRCFVQVGTLIFLTIALALSVQAANFSNASLQGSYSFLGTRFNANSDLPAVARIGVETFDGAGNFTESYTEIVGGTTSTGTFSGTYTVNPNGTGTINFGANQIGFTLNSTMAKVAHEWQFMLLTDSNNESSSGTAVLQSKTAETYSVANVKGNFGFQWNAWTADPSLPQQGMLGVLSFDGKGKVNGSATEMIEGALQSVTFTGVYAVNPDGSGAISLTGGAGNPQLAFVLNTVASKQSKCLQFLQTNSTGNVAVSGTALKQ